MRCLSKIFSAILLLCSGPLFAEFYVPGVFNDGMVLQRGMPVKIWGSAAPEAEVEARFGGQSASARADGNGLWSLHLPPMEASARGGRLELFENGRPAKEFSDVLVGEVWILGGQSNMDWDISKTDDYNDFLSARKNYGGLRCYRWGIPHSLKPEFKTGAGARWENAATQEDVSKWPCTGVYFAEALMKELEVPVGILRLCQSGTAMFVWIPEEAQRAAPFLAETFEKWQKRVDSYDYDAEVKKWNEDKAKWEADAERLKAEGRPVPDIPNRLKSPPKREPWYKCLYPGWLYNGRVAPVAGYTARGVLWYQGESDSTAGRVEIFDKNFALLVSEWRRAWGARLPFVFVQLAAYGSPHDWGLARWKQYLSYMSIPDSHIAVIPDLGDEKDIHFPAKKALALRLKNIAMEKVYGAPGGRSYGPFYKAAGFDGARAEIEVEDFGRGLRAKDGKNAAELSGFEAKDEKGAWLPARAELSGGKIRVFCEGAERISAVRYLWKAWCLPDVSLVNKDGLPLAPFTTN